MTPFSATAPGATLSAFREGDGEPLLLIQGVAGHHAVWGDAFVAALVEHHEVVTFDHRGIGDSSWVDEPFTIDDLVDDALAVLDAAGLADAHVLGFSMGGAVAQRIALQAPERVRTLTLVGTWGDTIDVWGPGVRKIADAGRLDDSRVALQMMFEANVSPGFAADAANLAAFAQAAARVQVPAAVVQMQMPAAAVHDVTDRLGSIDRPTLVVHGELDAIVNVAAGQRLAAGIPDSRLEVLSGRGHHVAWEASERVSSLVLEHAGRGRPG